MLFCYNCGEVLSEKNFCTSCGASVGRYKKIIYMSNRYYNRGLDKAQIRDLTSAAEDLRQSLKLYKRNTQARNLLGLVYFEMGEYVAIARRKGNTWYVAAMNNWTPIDLTIDLGKFLTKDMSMDCFCDGINADREATDYKHVTRKVSSTEKLNVHLAPGGGWTAIFR